MQQRTVRAVFVLGCAVALLLPILSIFDNDFFDRDAFDELAVAVATFVVSAVFIAVAIIERQPPAMAWQRLVTLSDPRSPPRA
jgi:hypothetical protein